MDLSKYIQSRYLSEEFLKENKIKFKNSRPFSNLILASFFRPLFFSRLQKSIVRQKFILKNSDLFQFSQTIDLEELDDELITEFYAFLASKEFSEWVSRLTGISLKPGALSLFGARYSYTDYLLCHDDQLEGRKVAYILYLGDNLTPKDGGSLDLFESFSGVPIKTLKKYYPQSNSITFFAVSEISFHAVSEILNKKKKRYSIGGWLK